MTTAKVTTSFPGVEDGKVYPRQIYVGEIISGDLAKVAIEEKWAVAVDPGVAAEPEGVAAKPEGVTPEEQKPDEEPTVALRPTQPDLLRATGPARGRK